MLPVFGVFLLIDVLFFSANALKFVEGGWFPIVVAAAVGVFVNVWRTGRRALRVAGTAVFITPRLDEIPGALLHNLKHNRVLHERVILLRVDVRDISCRRKPA